MFFLKKLNVHRGIFRTKLNIHDGAFFTSVKPYFKNVLNSIELPFRFHFLHNSWKNLQVKTSGEKVFC